jgi:hypothetical protein
MPGRALLAGRYRGLPCHVMLRCMGGQRSDDDQYGDEKTERRGRTPPCRRKKEEIEVTPEMVEAGANAILEWREIANSWDLASEVYLAMERVRRSRLAQATD